VAARLRRCAAAPTGRKRLPARSQGRVRVPAQARPGPQAVVSEVPAEWWGRRGGAAAGVGPAVANGGGAGTVMNGVGPAAAVAIGNPRSGARASHPDHSLGSLSTPSASDHSGARWVPAVRSYVKLGG